MNACNSSCVILNKLAFSNWRAKNPPLLRPYYVATASPTNCSHKKKRLNIIIKTANSIEDNYTLSWLFLVFL